MVYKGQIFTEEHRRNISKSLIGSHRHLGHVHTYETKRIISEKNKGRVLSEETRKKMSLAKKGVPRSEKIRELLAKMRTGRIVSDESRLKTSITKKERFAAGLYAPTWNKGKKLPESDRIQWSNKLKDKKFIPLTKIGVWRKSVCERDNFSCVICKKNNVVLEAHHVKLIRESPELKYDIGNGITLCKKCHFRVHNIKKYLIQQ